MLVATGPIVDKLENEIAEAKDIVVVENALKDDGTDKKIVAMLGNSTKVNVLNFLMDKNLDSMGTGTFDDDGMRVRIKCISIHSQNHNFYIIQLYLILTFGIS